MQAQTIRDGEVQVEYTSRALSGWGGLAVFFEYGRRSGFFDLLERCLPNKKTSPNQISGIDITKALFATVLMGGNRFAHVERVRSDEVLGTVMGSERIGGADTTRRYFEGLTASECESMYATLQMVMSSMLWQTTKEDVIDLDSTILERYGNQEGVAKGYHAARAGQSSHHPLLAMMAKSKHIVHTWLRAGGASTMRGSVEFVDELTARLPAGFKITAVRADSGFHTEAFIEALENKRIDYIVAIRMHRPMQQLAAQRAESEWSALDAEHDIAELIHHAHNWSRARRVLLIRRAIRQPGALFDTVSYEYNGLLTSLSMPANECSDFYDQRGDAENTIKEFKNDYGARGFCMNSFHATEAVFRMISVLFNLVAEFKRHVLRNCSVTLATVRVKVFVLGAILGRRARKTILRLGLKQRWKEGFDELLSRAVDAPRLTAAQLVSSQ